MKKIVLTGLFVFGLMFAVTSINAMGREIHLAGKDGVLTNQLRYTQTLRRGMVNTNVLALQKKLKEFGFYHKALDSVYGSGTITAIKQFQRTKGLKVDGIAGPKTFAMVLATDAISLNTGGIKPVKPIAGICTKEYKPVCGVVKLPFDDFVSRPQTFSNKCMAELAHAKVLYKGICKTNILPINGEPIVETNLVSYITDESAKLHGEVDLNGQDEIEAFFVYGQSFGKIQDVPSVYDSYSQIVEQGDSIQKEYVGDVEEDDEDFQKEVDNLHAGEGYYYRACVEFETLVEEYKKLTCGDIKRFETLSDSSIEQCLEIESDNFGTINDDVNISLNRGDRNKQIGEFIIKNTCNYPISLTDVYFDTLSSFNSASFKNINVEFGDCNATTETDFRPSIHNLNGFGDHLFFETEMNRPCTLDAHEDTAVNIFADIVGTYSYITGKPYYSAFAIGIDDVKYTYGNNENGGYIEEPIVWSKLITIK